MIHPKKAASSLLTLLVATTGLACGRPGGPGVTNEFGDNSTVLLNGAKCLPLLSAEVYPARSVVTHPGSAVPGGNIYFVSDLWNAFNTNCGNCHGSGQNQGNFSVNEDNFSIQVVATMPTTLQRIESDDPSQFMPPANSHNSGPFSQRGPNDPVRVLANLLEIWIAQGTPTGQFYLSFSDGGADAGRRDGGADDGGPNGDAAAGGPDGGAPQGAYTMTPETGANVSNIGTCIPNKYVVGMNGDAMDRLDAFFAQATQLPDTLAKTDLTTLESDALAHNGVVSYVPAYPLWSDSAGKMRYVRTPHNQPIVFDKSTQTFQIPPNTRFYKTFLKKVIDIDGNEAYRKIETRLIVSRPDTTAADGTVQQNALFGTYVWNDTETAATLQQDPLRDGLPFTDRLVTYNIDEPRAAAIQASTPPNLNLDYALDTASPPVRRHYAIPGSNRCIQCHMGSATASFVLGFLPLQIATHPSGTSGVIEGATGDELTQLQRLIDYNVVSGISSPDDVLPLEKSELPRTPRNDYELRAQGYMLGNCSHCHNPRGFPTAKAPVLKDLLDFLPRPAGGIFQFPLDRTSPLRARGANTDIPIPYITPSLRDIPEGSSFLYTPKFRACVGTKDSPETDGWCTKISSSPYVDFIDAPWRSLIYRNADTPFDYLDDLTIFPHMPMNTPGFDCRAPQILGDWMVSIPAVNPNAANENNVSDVAGLMGTVDTAPQPYTEVLPNDPAYATAQVAATKRLAQYHAGHRYNFCPDTSDIVDPDVISGALQTPADGPIYDDDVSPPQLVMDVDGVPNRPHWVVTDETDPPGPWYPRGGNWQDALVHDPPIADASGSGVLPADLQTVVDDLRSVYLDDDTKNVLTTPVPFALWQQKTGCDFSKVTTVGSYQGAERPTWMDAGKLDPNAPVLLESPGAAIFSNICINCHGPEADAKGLLADEISLMTGGNARVANFRAGLFGPESSPGMNRTELFAPVITPPDTATPDDFAARYMAWMALGGTKVQLPPQLLQVVAATRIAGQSRQNIQISGSSNMLQLARQLCSNVIQSDPGLYFVPLGRLPGRFPVDWSTATPLIGTTGDAEMWMKVCALNSRPIVHVLAPSANKVPRPPLPLSPQAADWSRYWNGADNLVTTGLSLYWGTDGTGADGIGAPVSPAGATFLDQRGQISTGDLLASGNLFPMCVREPPAGSDAHAAADALLQQLATNNTGGSVIPYCPDALFANGTDADGNAVQKWKLAAAYNADAQTYTFPAGNNWALRGAINAGLAVFLYINQLSQTGTPQLLYNQCELLSSSTAGTGAQP
jgi:mono/diheme cytochrome c family protein